MTCLLPMYVAVTWRYIWCFNSNWIQRFTLVGIKHTLPATRPWHKVTLRPRQNGRYLADDIFVFIFLNEDWCILNRNPLRFLPKVAIRFSDNDSIGIWPPGSLLILGADGHIKQRDLLFMWIKILCIEYILWGMPTIESTFDVANMVKTATVKDVPINNDALLNIQAC